MSTINSRAAERMGPVNLGQQRRFTIKRIAAIVITGITLLAVTGAAFQSIATVIDKRNYPAPGLMVDVGGFQMHINCLGEGSPTVILEPGGGGTSLDWFLVQPEIAKTTRACAYDRAGFGWSDPSPDPRDGQHIAAELHSLLQRANVPGPYVLAGWSYGGLFVRAFAMQYPEEMAGLALLDASHPDIWTRTKQGQSQYRNDSMLYTGTRLLSRSGLLRLFPIPFTSPPGSLPTERVAQWKAVHNATRYWDTTEAESRAILGTMAQVRQSSQLGDLPVMVVTAGENQGADGQWPVYQDELASSISTNSAHLILEGAGHQSLVFDPEYSKVSTRAILQVVDAVREGGSFKP
jgi:pimeloyl-ACP methyl ester carboxylesterase